MSVCGGCGAGPLCLIVSLGDMPLVNAYRTAQQVHQEQRFPLDLYLCPRCALVQIWPIVDPRLLFTEHVYRSSVSRTNQIHLFQLADRLARTFQVDAGAQVLEIGSNDGTFLGRMRRYTPRVLGMDPAQAAAAVAAEQGVPTVVDFFSARVARALISQHGAFDLVVALNVVAHTPDFVDLLAGVKDVLAPDGRFVMETVDVLQTILRGEIDTIYHEHVYCFSLRALAAACARVGLTIVGAQKVAMQGGSLRLVMQRSERHDPIHAGVDAAPARGVVLLNYCGLSPADIDFVVDDTPTKAGKVVPGCHIPIAGWKGIARDQPISALMLSWNYRDEILAKLKARTGRARILVPLPAVHDLVLGVPPGDVVAGPRAGAAGRLAR